MSTQGPGPRHQQQNSEKDIPPPTQLRLCPLWVISVHSAVQNVMSAESGHSAVRLECPLWARSGHHWIIATEGQWACNGQSRRAVYPTPCARPDAPIG